MTSLNRNLNHTAQLSISWGEIIILSVGLGGNNGKDPLLYFYFLQIVLKIPPFEKSDEDKSTGELAKPTNNLICLLLSSVIVKIFYRNC